MTFKWKLVWGIVDRSTNLYKMFHSSLPGVSFARQELSLRRSFDSRVATKMLTGLCSLNLLFRVLVSLVNATRNYILSRNPTLVTRFVAGMRGGQGLESAKSIEKLLIIVCKNCKYRVQMCLNVILFVVNSALAVSIYFTNHHDRSHNGALLRFQTISIGISRRPTTIFWYHSLALFIFGL